MVGTLESGTEKPFLKTGTEGFKGGKKTIKRERKDEEGEGEAA